MQMFTYIKTKAEWKDIMMVCAKVRDDRDLRCGCVWGKGTKD